jgi:putative ABC transport system substrate-binding protein
VQVGLVASISRPGGNVTGATALAVELAPKRLELARELVPTASIIAALINPTNRMTAEPQLRDLQGAARALGLQLHIAQASTERDFDAVFTNLAELRPGALVIGTDGFFISRSEQLAAMTVRHGMPAIFENREFVAAGGLMSYGGSLPDAYRLAGIYVARILKGEKPGELPVQQSTTVQMFLNLKTAKALGITVPPPLLGRADEVIE